VTSKGPRAAAQWTSIGGRKQKVASAGFEPVETVCDASTDGHAVAMELEEEDADPSVPELLCSSGGTGSNTFHTVATSSHAAWDAGGLNFSLIQPPSLSAALPGPPRVRGPQGISGPSDVQGHPEQMMVLPQGPDTWRLGDGRSCGDNSEG